MHIVIIISRFYPYWGGAQLRIKRVAEVLIERGFSVSVLTPRMNRDIPKHEVLPSGIKVYRFPKTRFFFIKSTQSWLAKNHEQINLVHTIRADKNGPIGAWAKRKLGLPHVTDIITNEVKRLLSGTEAGLRRWETIRKGTDLLHCLNQEMVGVLKRAGVPDRQVWYRPNAVDTDLFTSAKKQETNQEVIVLCCGRIEKQKGTDILIAAWRALPTTVRKQARLFIVGNGKWEEQMRLEAAGLDNLEFSGACPREDMPDCYRRADIYVQPSRFEGLSNSILEAMASGLPVITTNVDGNPDLVKDGVNGILITSEDTLALSKALETLIGNPEIRRMMGVASRRIAEESFSYPKFLNDYEQMYLRLLKAD